MPEVPPPGRFRRLGDFVARHEGVAFTLAYLALASIGMLHLAAFYAEFGINVLHFAEVGDFLLAPLRDPFVVLVSLLPVPVIALLRWLDRAWSHGWQRLRRKAPDPRRAERDRRRAEWFGRLAIVLWMIAFNLRYVDATTDAIKAGRGKRVAAVLADGRPVVDGADSTVILLPATARYVFFYRPARRDLVIVPVDHLGTITTGGVRRR